MQNSIFKLFEHKCVLEVCVHIHPIMIKIHPVFFFFFYPYVKIPFLKSGCSEIPVSTVAERAQIEKPPAN